MRDLNSNQDLYKFIRELIQAADEHSDHETSQHLRDALETNFTSSEILGETRKVLNELKRTDMPYLEPYRTDIARAIRGINRAFRITNLPHF